MSDPAAHFIGRSALVRTSLETSIARKRWLAEIAIRRGSRQMIFLFGNSIAQGFVRGRYELDSDPNKTSPLLFVDLTIDLLSAANDFAVTCAYCGSAAPDAIHEIRDAMRPGDHLAILEAGFRPGNFEASETRIEAALRAGAALGLAPHVFTNLDGPAAPFDCRYQSPIGDQRSANEAIRAAARRTQANLIDLEALLPPEDVTSLGLLQDDGVHVTLAGSLLYAGLLLRSATLRTLSLSAAFPYLRTLWSETTGDATPNDARLAALIERLEQAVHGQLTPVGHTKN